MLKVTKFGGSSVASAKQFKKVKNIVLDDESRHIVVVSAVGKDQENPSKITDLLYLLHAHLELNIEHTTLLDTIYNRFKTIQQDLKLSFDIEQELKGLQKELHSKISKDYLVSRGEYLTAKLIAEYLDYTFIDAQDVIVLEYDGHVNYDVSSVLLKEALEKHKNIVVPGFYAVTPDKEVRLFPRGGSDISGSIIARCTNADLYENWTDVNGIYVTSPSIIKDVMQIEEITYRELREISYRGANVLHEETIIPLEDKNIPILIKNTNKPFDKGTLITSTLSSKQRLMTGIAGKQDFTSFNINKTSDVSKIRVLRDVLNLFIRYHVNIEHIPSGIDSFSVIVETDQIKQNRFDLINEIRNIEGVLDLQVESDISLIAVVGRNMANIPGIAGRLFSALGKEGVNIKIIGQASTEISIIIGVSNKDYKNTVITIYNTFFRE